MTELSREARELIARARPAERADVSTKKRVRAALAAHLGPLPAPLPPAAPVAGASGAGLAASKLVLICSLAAAGVVGTTALVKTRRAPQPVPAVQQTKRPAPPTLVAPAARQPRESVPAAAAPVPGVVRPVLTAPVRRVAVRAPSGRTGEPAREMAVVLAAVPKPEVAAALVPEVSASPEPPSSVASPTSSWRSSSLPEPVPDREGARPAASSKPGNECSAERELGLLSRAQAALRARSGQRALDLLAEHAAVCPLATFWQERSAARALALCLLHREPQALAEAARLASLAPRSPLLARLRTSCAAAAVKP